MKPFFHKYQKIIKFLVSGGTAAVIEFVCFVVLIYAGLPVLLSGALSFLAGLVTSFALNKLWVFGVSDNTRKQVVQYLCLAAINLLLTTFVLWILVDVLHVPELVSKFAVMAMVAIWNYLLFSRFIFK